MNWQHRRKPQFPSVRHIPPPLQVTWQHNSTWIPMPMSPPPGTYGLSISGGWGLIPASGQAGQPEELPELELSFGVEPIIAWRAWKLMTFQTREERVMRLVPVAVSPLMSPWIPGQPAEARCTSEPHQAPWPTCACGLWALQAKGPASMAAPIIGKVALWGRVLEFERGYRSEYAYPVELWAMRGVALPEGSLDQYGVPVHYESN